MSTHCFANSLSSWGSSKFLNGLKGYLEMDEKFWIDLQDRRKVSLLIKESMLLDLKKYFYLVPRLQNHL